MGTRSRATPAELIFRTESPEHRRWRLRLRRYVDVAAAALENHNDREGPDAPAPDNVVRSFRRIGIPVPHSCTGGRLHAALMDWAEAMVWMRPINETDVIGRGRRPHTEPWESVD